MINSIDMFISFLCAFIVKDFYDIFVSPHIKSFFEKRKESFLNGK